MSRSLYEQAAPSSGDDARRDVCPPLAELGGYLTRPFDNELNVQKVVNAAIERL
ncbi:MAG: hypothetical protein RL033_1333 [Pseudomonadota bacterium]